MTIGFLIFLGIIIVAVLFIIGIYNQLVSLRNQYQTQFAQIDVQMKRRHDLIPNLVETAKGYLKHEKETLENVTQARNGASQALSALAKSPGSAQLMEQFGMAENALMGALGKLSVVVEAYPELKADQSMKDVSDAISDAENKISHARRSYNESVMSYNVYRQSFPNNVFAGLFGHHVDARLLEFQDKQAIKEVPEIKF